MEPRSIGVLLVDDNPADLVIEAIALSELPLSIHVDMACDGAEALRMIEDGARNRKTYDVVFVDRDMPGMSGVALIAKMKKMYAFRPKVICALTGSARKKDHDELEGIGVDRIICKEMCVSDLSESLRCFFADFSPAGDWREILM